MRFQISNLRAAVVLAAAFATVITMDVRAQGTTNPPGVVPVSPPVSLLPYAQVLANPTNGQVVYPPNFWASNAAPAGGVVASSGGTSTNESLTTPTINGGKVNADVSGATNLEAEMMVNIALPPWNCDATGATNAITGFTNAIYWACLSNSTPKTILVPEGTFVLTGKVSLPIHMAAVTIEGAKPFRIKGVGGRSSILRWPTATGNGIEYFIDQQSATNGQWTFLSQWRLEKVGLEGPAWTNISNDVEGNTNVTAQAVFLGFDPAMGYLNAAGWNADIEDCFIYGWKTGICATNFVGLSVKRNHIKYNWFAGVYIAHSDTCEIVDRNVILSADATNGQAAIVIESQNGVILGGRGVTIMDNEIGGFPAAIYDNGTPLVSIGGNFERNGRLLVSSNYADVTLIAPHVLNNVQGAQGFIHFGNRFAASTFKLYGGDGLATANTNSIAQGWTNLFSENDSIFVAPRFYGLSPQTMCFNGGVPTTLYAVGETPNTNPLWTASLTLSRPAQSFHWNTDTTLGSTAPSPFLSINYGYVASNDQAQVIYAVPHGLGFNSLVSTLTFLGDTGATNMALDIWNVAESYVANTGYTTTSADTQVTGITNLMLKTVSWTNTFVDDVSPRDLRVYFSAAGVGHGNVTNKVWVLDWTVKSQ